jgi:hypothetical protein
MKLVSVVGHQRRGGWFLALVFGLLVLAAAPGVARASAFGFGKPVFVDPVLHGGEPTVAYALKSGLLVYTSHEGTTHLYSSAAPFAPAESGGFLGNYHNQVNIWTSANHGRSWQLVPFGSATNPLATGFSDPDLTQDDARNIYNTGINLANDALFSSQNGGRTWPTGTAQCHEGDRPWLAGGKANEVFLSTDTVEAGHQIFHSTDAGASCDPHGISDSGSTPDGGTYLGQGKLFYDHRRGSLVEPIYYVGKNGRPDGVGLGILPSASSAFSNPSAAFSQVRIASTSAYAHWPSMGIDSAGHYYMVWDTDDRDPNSANGCPPQDSGSESFGSVPPTNAQTPLANRVMLAYSTDGGQHWSSPRTVAYSSGHRLLWPWITAGSAGRVGVVWYQYDRVVDPDCAPRDAAVSAMAARIFSADTAHPSETVVNAAGRPIHHGAICAGGTTCAVTVGVTGEDRRLGDYFTDAVDNSGCMLIATGDTTLNDAFTGEISPISHPLFLTQSQGLGLNGKACGQTAASRPGHRHPAKHRPKRRPATHRRPTRAPSFTG